MQERPRLNPRHSPVASPIDNSRNVILLQTLARPHVARHFRQLPRGRRRRGGSSQARREAMTLIPLISALAAAPERATARAGGDRQSVLWGKSVSVRVDLGGRVIIKKTKK